MTSFYDDKDLEEELGLVNCPDGDLKFEDLFEYEPPCSDFPGGDQGLSDECMYMCDGGGGGGGGAE